MTAEIVCQLKNAPGLCAAVLTNPNIADFTETLELFPDIPLIHE
jgi:hypothetical protein